MTSQIYTEYVNPYPGCYTVHLGVRAENDKEAVELQRKIVFLLQEHNISISETYVTDADDWAEFVHHDDHPDAIRVGVGRRIVIDEYGRRVP